jgi:hypothetical protein
MHRNITQVEGWPDARLSGAQFQVLEGGKIHFCTAICHSPCSLTSKQTALHSALPAYCESHYHPFCSQDLLIWSVDDPLLLYSPGTPRFPNACLGEFASNPTLCSAIQYTRKHSADDDNWATHGVRHHLHALNSTSVRYFNKHTDRGNVLHLTGL